MSVLRKMIYATTALLAASAALLSTTPLPRDLGAFKRAADEIRRTHQVPGLTVALVKNREILWAGGLGLANRERQVPFTEHTIVRVASLSKMVVALTHLRLAHQGRLALDTPIQTLVPNAPITCDAPISVAHVLEHTAGFDDMRPAHLLRANIDLPERLTATIARLGRELRCRWRPGERFSYSNSGYALAGHIVEQATDQPFWQVANREVFVPLGFDNTGFGRIGPEIHRATGYTTDGEVVAYHPNFLYPAGDLSTTGEDLARLLTMLTQRGTIDGQVYLPTSLIDRMERPETTAAARAGLAAGYGLGNATSYTAGLRTQGHEGSGSAFITLFQYSVEQQLGYAVVLNQPNWRAAAKIAKLSVRFLTQDHLPVKPGDLDEDAIPSEALAGYYRATNPRHALIAAILGLKDPVLVEVKGRMVTVEHPVFGGTRKLYAMPGNQLRGERQTHATAIFMPDHPEGRRLQIDGHWYEPASWFEVALPVWGLLACLAALVSSLAVLPWWLAVWVFRRAPTTLHRFARLWPLITLSGLGLLGYGFASLEFDTAGTMGPATVGIFLSTWLIPVSALFGLGHASLAFRAPMNPIIRGHTLLAAIGAVGMSLFLGHAGFIGLKLWS